MLKVITDPVETQVRDFYYRRAEKESTSELTEIAEATPEEIEPIRKKLEENDFNLSALTEDERQMLLGAPDEMPVLMPAEGVRGAATARCKPGAPEEIAFKMKVYPGYINYLSNKGEALLASKQYLTTLSAQEAFVVYFKVSLLCGDRAGQPVDPLPVLGVRRGRAVPARAEVRLHVVRPEPAACSSPGCCCASSSSCPGRSRRCSSSTSGSGSTRTSG